MANTELDVRNKNELAASFDLADSVVYKRWLSALNNMEIVECPKELSETYLGDIASFFKVERFVYEKTKISVINLSLFFMPFQAAAVQF